MKKFFLILYLPIILFASIGCSVSSRNTSEKLVNIIETLEINNLDDSFDPKLNSYIYRGDAYYLMGEKNEYIELYIYYKQKYAYLYIEFELNSSDSLEITNINMEYYDLFDELYISFDTIEDNNSFSLEENTYELYFEELEALSIADIEWILTTLDLL